MSFRLSSLRVGWSRNSRHMHSVLRTSRESNVSLLLEYKVSSFFLSFFLCIYILETQLPA